MRFFERGVEEREKIMELENFLCIGQPYQVTFVLARKAAAKSG